MSEWPGAKPGRKLKGTRPDRVSQVRKTEKAAPSIDPEGPELTAAQVRAKIRRSGYHGSQRR
jgi:hypothetical protein